MSILSKLQALLTAANTTTGESDTTLTDAVQTLVDGYEAIDSILTRTVVSYTNERITNIGEAAFEGCSSLTSINLPNLTRLAPYVFNRCTSLVSIVLPSVTAIDNNAIQNCTSLTTADLPVCTHLDQKVFGGDSVFSNLIIRSNTVCTLKNVDVFTNTPFNSNVGGTLYVPSSLISDYESAGNWNTVLSRTQNKILPIEGSIYETQYADGTPIS